MLESEVGRYVPSSRNGAPTGPLPTRVAALDDALAKHDDTNAGILGRLDAIEAELERAAEAEAEANEG